MLQIDYLYMVYMQEHILTLYHLYQMEVFLMNLIQNYRLEFNILLIHNGLFKCIYLYG